MTMQDGGAVIRKRGTGLQVQVYAGRDPLSGRKRYVSQQVAGQTKASMRQAKQIEARLLEEIGAGRHRGSRSRTMGELLERWLEWRPTVRPIAPTTVSSYRAAMDRYILPALGKLPVRRVAHAKDALAFGTTLAADAYVFSHVSDGSAPIDPGGISPAWLALLLSDGHRPPTCRLGHRHDPQPCDPTLPEWQAPQGGAG
jgi:Phage integrase, N-terminal SAM-like domain